MLRNVVQDSDAGRSINVTKTLSSLAMNLTLCINFGRDYCDKVADEAEILVHTFHKVIYQSQHFNIPLQSLNLHTFLRLLISRI